MIRMFVLSFSVECITVSVYMYLHCETTELYILQLKDLINFIEMMQTSLCKRQMYESSKDRPSVNI